MKPPEAKLPRMFIPLQETVNTGVVDTAGWLLGGGGLLLTALWLHYLYN